MPPPRSGSTPTAEGVRPPLVSRTTLAYALVLVALTLLGVGVRMLTWRSVMTPAGVRFQSDTDPHYHVLRAEHILAGRRAAVWTDPNMDYPHGAPVIWPPLFDTMLASSARLAAGPAPTRRELEIAAAAVPPLLGALTVPAAAGLAGALLGAGHALAVAAIVAVLPGHFALTAFGRPDQHAAELLLFVLTLLAFARGPGLGQRGAALPSAGWLAAALTASFWNWQGSSMYPALLCAFAAIWYWIGERSSAAAPARALVLPLLLAALLLEVGAAILGPAGAAVRFDLNGVSAFPALVCATLAAFSAALVLAAGRPWDASFAARTSALAAAAVVPPLLLVAPLAGAREAIRHGLDALDGSHAWYGTISEFDPLVLSGSLPIGTELREAYLTFGPLLLAAPLALPALRRRFRSEPGRRRTIAFLLFGTLVFAVATLAHRRLGLYLMPFVALLGSQALARRSDASRPGRPLAAAALFVLTVTPFAMGWQGSRMIPIGRQDEPLIETLSWVRRNPDLGGGEPAIWGTWEQGHLIQYYAGRPCIATPFGTESGVDSMRDMAALLYARAEDDVVTILTRRHAGLVLLEAPLERGLEAWPFAPAGSAPFGRIERDRLRGVSAEVVDRAALEQLVVRRLHLRDGSGVAGTDLAALGHFRLVAEGPTGPGDSQVKLFELVAGAHVEVAGATGGAVVEGRVAISTGSGRRGEWVTSARADLAGSCTLRVPWATGANGRVSAGPLQVSDRAHRAMVSMAESAIREGSSIHVNLSGRSD